MDKYSQLRAQIETAQIDFDTAEAAFKYRYSVVEPPQLPKKPSKPNAPLVVLGAHRLASSWGPSRRSRRSYAGVDSWRAGRSNGPWTFRSRPRLTSPRCPNTKSNEGGSRVRGPRREPGGVPGAPARAAAAAARHGEVGFRARAPPSRRRSLPGRAGQRSRRGRSRLRRRVPARDDARSPLRLRRRPSGPRRLVRLRHQRLVHRPDHLDIGLAHGTTPMFTLYAMAQKNEDDTSVLTDDEYMGAYWKGARLLFQRLGAFGKPSVVHLEPDFWGFAQRFSPDGTREVRVKRFAPECADLGDDLKGMAGWLAPARSAVRAARGRRLSRLALGRPATIRRAIPARPSAPTRRISSSPRCSTATPAAGSEPPRSPARALGSPASISTNRTDEPELPRGIGLGEGRARRPGAPPPGWQLPLGVPSDKPGGLARHYRDNRVHYLFDHVDEFILAGSVGAVFGSKAFHQTSIFTDGGQFRDAVADYFANPRELPRIRARRHPSRLCSPGLNGASSASCSSSRSRCGARGSLLCPNEPFSDRTVYHYHASMMALWQGLHRPGRRPDELLPRRLPRAPRPLLRRLRREVHRGLWGQSDPGRHSGGRRISAWRAPLRAARRALRGAVRRGRIRRSCSWRRSSPRRTRSARARRGRSGSSSVPSVSRSAEHGSPARAERSSPSSLTCGPLRSFSCPAPSSSRGWIAGRLARRSSTPPPPPA